MCVALDKAFLPSLVCAAMNNAVAKLWGTAVTTGETGFTPVPDILLRSQERMRLTPMELVVLLNVLMHWWEPGDWPHPRISAISDRIGTTPRTVQRAIRTLQDKGLLVHRLPEKRRAGGTIRRYDLSGLVARLQELAEEHREARRILDTYYRQEDSKPAGIELSSRRAKDIAGIDEVPF